MEVRLATMSDVKSMSVLLTQLGYPTSVKQMKERFERIQSHGDYRTWLALVNGEVVGLIAAVKSYFYEKDGEYVRIVAFVVDGEHRGQGVGQKLMQRAEDWATSIGACTMALNSGAKEERTNAHGYYKKAGFLETNVGFTKSMK
ncbi:GNAT family N-acetyltransferase [Geomicrobium sediminis]|uniref:GNAT superfamily N-acetyltransferase n=1 Tax=Geomicrobium sediminis TaxID=1347788 RepID=A0ABS2PHH3_9BACL|nr:GNAT family N-acetyltransferase [Geomicrobium sediminis]MBM7634882.1 GNAT superfamily N-acetyltransferase [Geomicrobium sediminis]